MPSVGPGKQGGEVKTHPELNKVGDFDPLYLGEALTGKFIGMGLIGLGKKAHGIQARMHHITLDALSEIGHIEGAFTIEMA